MIHPRLLRHPSLLPFLCAALAAVFITAFLVPAVPKPTRLWRGYCTLLVREGTVAAARLERLPAALEAVTVMSAPASYTDFEGPVSVAVSRLPAVLDPLDPRYDPYLKGLAAYFRTADSPAAWGILYIPSRENAFFLFLRLWGELGSPAQWRLLEFSPLQALTAAVFLSLFSLLLVRGRGKGGGDAVLVCLNAFLWVAVGGGASAIATAAVETILWLRLLDAVQAGASKPASRAGSANPLHGEIARELFAYLSVTVLLAALQAFVFDASGEHIFAQASAALCSLILAAAVFPMTGMKKPSRRRRPAGRHPVSAVPPWALAACAAGFSLLSGAASLAGPGPLPAPRGAGPASGVTWDSVQDAGAEPGIGGRLPDMRDAIAHEAFQQSLVFGRPYGVPSRGERVVIPEYIWSESARALVEAGRTVKVFDDGWLDRFASRAPAASVERMLLRQRSPYGVVRLGRAGLLLREVPFLLSGLLLLFGVCLYPAAPRALITGRQKGLNRRA